MDAAVVWGTMSWTEAQILQLRSSVEGARAAHAPLLRVRHSMQRDSCWENSEKVAMIDTCLQGWVCPPIYIINRLDTIDEVDDGEQLVFDGAHKLESVFQFINNVFPLRATPFSCREIRENDGKYFRDLTNDLKNRIRSYKFCVNTVDDDTANDPDRLRVLWERLNKAGRKLTSYELSIPSITPLIDSVLKPAMSTFRESLLFPKSHSQRGDLEQRLQVILALAEIYEPTSSSQTTLIAKWHKECLGTTMAERTINIEKKKEMWSDILARAFKVMSDLEQLNVFHDAEGVLDLTDGRRKTELPFVLGRIVRTFVRIEDFRSVKTLIANKLRSQLFGKTQLDLLQEFDVSCRDGTFQKRLLKKIDGIILSAGGMVQPRIFTLKQKKEKLAEQGGLCAGCGEKILKHQLADGDHVVAWSEGGATTPENLQILHRHCHQQKTGAPAPG
jgi:hypothetical protein